MIDLELYEELGQNPLKITLEEDEVQLLFDYTDLKKKVLKELKHPFSNKTRIQLSFVGIYDNLPNMVTPIQSQENLEFLMQFILENSLDIKILLQPIRKLLEKRRRKKEEAVEFDSDGSVQSFDEERFVKIVPSEGRYNGFAQVRCAFCHQSSQNRHLIKQLGAFYGPFGKSHYVHLICAIWCSDIYLDKHDNSLMNVEKEVEKAVKSKCKVCGKGGATSLCHSPGNCTYQVHYRCGKIDGCQFNWHWFVFLCPKCKKNQNKRKKLNWDVLKEAEQEDQYEQKGSREISKDSAFQPRKNKAFVKIEIQELQ